MQGTYGLSATASSWIKGRRLERGKVDGMKRLMMASVILAAGIAAIAIAGSIDSPGDPLAGSGMPTLNQVYDYLTTGTAAVIAGSFEDPTAGPGPAMHTINEVYAAVATPFPQCNALPSDVRAGVKFFCTQPGYWGVQTGTALSTPTPTPTPSTTLTPTPAPTITPGGTFIQVGSVFVPTGLSNAGTYNNGTITHTDAVSWAAGLSYAGYSSGWRLPTQDELAQICVVRSSLGGYASADHWTSTLQAAGRYYTVKFGSPCDSGDDPEDSLRNVRAVRDSL